MLGELRAVLEVEFVLATLLRGTGSNQPLLPSVAQNGRAELLVHEDAGVLLGYAVRHGDPYGVEDDSLDRGNLHCLFGTQRSLPAEHFF